MTARLPFTGNDEADELVSSDALALLIGFALDQQVTVQKAFSGPLDMRARLGHLDAKQIAATDPAELDRVFRERPAIHRFPGSMAGKVQALAAAIAEKYEGDASRIWGEATDGRDLERRLLELPGIGPMKAKTILAVLGKRLGVELPGMADVMPQHPTLGDVDTAEALASTRRGSGPTRRSSGHRASASEARALRRARTTCAAGMIVASSTTSFPDRPEDATACLTAPTPTPPRQLDPTVWRALGHGHTIDITTTGRPAASRAGSRSCSTTSAGGSTSPGLPNAQRDRAWLLNLRADPQPDSPFEAARRRRTCMPRRERSPTSTSVARSSRRSRASGAATPSR